MEGGLSQRDFYVELALLKMESWSISVASSRIGDLGPVTETAGIHVNLR
jgi:hypothetical protein